MRNLLYRHVVQVRDITGKIEPSATHRTVTKHAAHVYADLMRSPMYDVLIDGQVAHAHTPPEQLLAQLRKSGH